MTCQGRPSRELKVVLSDFVTAHDFGEGTPQRLPIQVPCQPSASGML